MAKGKATEAVNTTASRSESIDLDEIQGRNALAAWKMLYNLYGARVDSWGDPTSTGISAKGFSTFSQYDPNTVIADISSRTRRLDFLTVSPWVNGEAPTPYTDASEITADTVQFYKGAVEEGSAKSPKYVKDATAAFKAANDLTKKRGPKPKSIRLDNMDDLNDEVFEQMDPENIAILQAALERVAKAKANPQTVGATS